MQPQPRLNRIGVDMGVVATKRAKKQAIEQRTADLSRDDLIEQAGDFIATVTIVNGLPVDFDGVSISIIREPETNRLQAVIISPVDMHAGEPFARYAVEPSHVAAPKTPRLVLPS